MSVLVTAATAAEIAPLIHRLTKNSSKSSVEILITGVGAISTTYALMKQLTLKKPALMIQAGLAGAFDQRITLGSVFLVERDRLGDLGVVEKNELRSVFEMGLGDPDQFPFKNGWLRNNTSRDLIRKSGLQRVTGITVNQVTTSGDMNSLLFKKYRPAIESLEGAAFHYVALREKIPFIQLRGVSNYIGERDKKKWKLREATGNLNKELNRIINNY